jgi:Diacylglycerol kinase catalytic domain
VTQRWQGEHHAVRVDVDVVVNLRARRGSRRVAEKLRAELPKASVLLSHSLEEAVAFTRQSRGDLLLSAGGDGTAIGILNSLRQDKIRWPALGMLPLGTGNAWAHATGAPAWRKGAQRLAGLLEREAPLPLRRFGLLEVQVPGKPGALSHFAGTGWDAEIIDDFHAQKQLGGILPRRLRQGLAGYLNGVFTRTIPRHIFTRELPEVTIVNTGEDALTVGPDGQAQRLPGGEHGKILYQGPTTVCAAGTSETWGFGFRAFPFASLVPGRFSLRIYAGNAAEATLHMPQLWRGVHPIEKMHNFLLTGCKARFSRKVPFQLGGDRLGHQDQVEYALARESVDLLDWTKIAA